MDAQESKKDKRDSLGTHQNTNLHPLYMPDTPAHSSRLSYLTAGTTYAHINFITLQRILFIHLPYKLLDFLKEQLHPIILQQLGSCASVLHWSVNLNVFLALLNSPSVAEISGLQAQSGLKENIPPAKIFVVSID